MNRKSLVGKFLIGGMCIGLLFAQMPNMNAFAEGTGNVSEISYCEDEAYNGMGEHVDASYEVQYDTVNITNVNYVSAPSFGYLGSEIHDACAPLAGTNVVGFYDRWCENLIPDYTPGQISASKYIYYPDMSRPQTIQAFNDMYEAMGTNKEQVGTTGTNFKNGLNSYVRSAGYDISWSSMYESSTSVNLNTLTDAIDNNKVGVVMCSKYNFCYGVLNSTSDKTVRVNKITSVAGHIMMVYGYRIIEYYDAGNLFRKDIFLNVSSSYPTSERGYMQLNDYSVIEEAYIVDIN